MRRIKRVLWIDDHPNPETGMLFYPDETNIVYTLDDALIEISSNALYEYDCVVFDINFKEGIHDYNNVTSTLSSILFLDDTDKQRINIEKYGGYFLSLYLLVRGFPAKQVAFLTGNASMLLSIKVYEGIEASAEDICSVINEAYLRSKDDEGQSLGTFSDIIKDELVPDFYKQSYIINKMFSCLKNKGELLELIPKLSEAHKKDRLRENIQATKNNLMITRFHNANLEPPDFFSKNTGFIESHCKEDAVNWLSNIRTIDRCSRWLILDAGNHVDELFKNDSAGMINRMKTLFYNVDGDPGIQSAFSQLYNLFLGMRKDGSDAGTPYYQAIAGLMIPFDNKPDNHNSIDYYSSISNNNVTDAVLDLYVQNVCLNLAKQTRNFCLHNYFGTSISNKTALYIIMYTIAGILDRNQRETFNDWFENVFAMLAVQGNNYNESRRMYYFGNISADYSYPIIFKSKDNIEKIDSLLLKLLNATSILDTQNADKVTRNRAGVNYYKTTATPYHKLICLGWNNQMSMDSCMSMREEYYKFILASYVVLWFGIKEDKEEKEKEAIKAIENKFGKSIKLLYILSNEIVHDYTYPYQL